MKLNIENRKLISNSKFVISKQSSKSKVKNKTFAILSKEMNSDNERKRLTRRKRIIKKNDDENDENFEKMNVFLIVKKLFDQKNYKIVDFTKRINDVKTNHVDVSNIQNFEKNEIILFANKKDVDRIFILIIKTYTLYNFSECINYTQYI